jgi:hypothetical protein
MQVHLSGVAESGWCPVAEPAARRVPEQGVCELFVDHVLRVGIGCHAFKLLQQAVVGLALVLF